MSTLLRGGPIVVGIAYNAYPQNILCLKCLPTIFEILLHINPKNSKNCQSFRPKIHNILL